MQSIIRIAIFPIIVVLCGAGILLPSVAAEARFFVDYHEDVDRLEIVTGTDQVSQKSLPASAAQIRFDAFGYSFELELEANARLLDRLERPPIKTRLYQGRIAGKTDSWARVTLAGEQLHAMVWDGAELYMIEPASAIPAIGPRSNDSDRAVIFRLSDVRSDGTHFCPVHRVSHDEDVLADFKAMTDDFQIKAVVNPKMLALKRLDMGVVGDFEFTDAKSDPEGALLARMNNVDGIYQNQVGVQLSVALTDFYPVNNDPFTTNDAGDLLNELADFKVGSAHAAMGLTHLFTGRNLDGSTVGIAFLDTLCSPRFGVGLSEGNTVVAFDSLIAAHEIGHNFGAPHDGVAGSACQSTPQTFIMAPSINLSNNTFSACSLQEMQPAIDNASCLIDIDLADVELTLPATQILAQATVDFQYPLLIRSLGTEAVQNVDVEITLPAQLILIASMADGGTCTSGAGLVVCSLGDMPPNTQRNVMLTLRSDQPSVFQTDVNVTADNDALSNNNSGSVQINVTADVDLALSTSGQTQLSVGSSTTVSFMAQNNSSQFDASAVSIDITVPAGLTVNTVTGAGTCVMQALRVLCANLSVAAGATAAINLNITGQQVGQRVLIGLISSATSADPVGTNDTANLSISVVESGDSGGGSGGGGGSLGTLCLWLLFFTLARRRTLPIRR